MMLNGKIVKTFLLKLGMRQIYYYNIYSMLYWSFLLLQEGKKINRRYKAQEKGNKTVIIHIDINDMYCH